MTDNGVPLKTVRRAFEVVELLWERTSATPAELAEELDVPRSTVYDYLQTLGAVGYVERVDGAYRLSYKPLTIGGRVQYRSRLFRVARSELQRVVEDTGEVADINVEDAGEAVVLHYERGEQALDLGMYPGMRTPLHTHASGKAILAHLPADRVAEILDERGLAAVTDETITSAESLESELAEIRERGYAVDWDEQVRGMGVVAAPILLDGEVLGAVGVLAPTDRIRNEEYQRRLQQRVREASSTISINYEFSK